MLLLNRVSARWSVINRNIKLIALSMFIWELGLMLYDAILPVYLGELGARPVQIGAIFSSVFLVVSISSLAGGWLADRFEKKTIMLVFWIIGTPSVLLISMANSWQSILPGLVLYYLSFIAFPSINAYITASSEPEHLSSSFALLYATFPVAQLVGPGLGGFIAHEWGMRPLFLVSFVCYLLSTSVIATIQRQPSPIEPMTIGYEHWRAKTSRQMTGFWNYVLLASVTYAFFTLLLRFTSPFLVEFRQLDLFSIGVLNSSAAVGAVILTVMFGQLGAGINRIQLLAGTIVIFSISMVLIAYTDTLALLFLAFILQGCFIAARSLMDSMVASSSRGRKIGWSFGMFGLMTGLGQTVAPSIGGWLYQQAPISAFYSTAAAGIVLAVILVANRAIDEP